MNDLVFLHGQAVGDVQVKRQGLYYRITCRCKLPDERLYCLKVTCGERVRELGICVPVENGFGVDTSVPVKKIGEGPLRFDIALKCQQKQEKVIPVREDTPFADLQDLPRARLRIIGDTVGIIIQSEK